MPAEYEVAVVDTSDLTPNMRRIILSGDALTAFPRDQESGYVKLMFPDWPQASPAKPPMRSYTIRYFDPVEKVLTLDFACHAAIGPASQWAESARAGDVIHLRGPGEKKLADPAADWYLLAGDMSALPALSVNLEQLPEDATGYAFVEVLHEDDIQPLAHPPGIDLHWVVNPNTACPNHPLVEAVLSAPWLAGTPYPWFAGEFDAMRRMRRYFRDERKIDRNAMYVSSYWKAGDTDEGMKRAKQLDPEK